MTYCNNMRLIYCDMTYCNDTCFEFAAKHNIVFNSRKTKAMYFPCKFFKTTDHNLTVNDQHVEFVNSIKYLCVTISSVLSDELDIKARVRSIHCIANMLRTRFFKCSVNAKNILFRYFCFSIYGINFSYRYPTSSINRLPVAYNNAYRILFNLPGRMLLLFVNEKTYCKFYNKMQALSKRFHSTNFWLCMLFFILIFQYITQNYILAKLALMFMLCVVHDKFVCVFLFFALLWTFVESGTNNNNNITYLLRYDILQQYVTYLLRYDKLQQYVTYLLHVGTVGAFRVLFVCRFISLPQRRQVL